MSSFTIGLCCFQNVGIDHHSCRLVTENSDFNKLSSIGHAAMKDIDANESARLIVSLYLCCLHLFQSFLCRVSSLQRYACNNIGQRPYLLLFDTRSFCAAFVSSSFRLRADCCFWICFMFFSCGSVSALLLDFNTNRNERFYLIVRL